MDFCVDPITALCMAILAGGCGFGAGWAFALERRPAQPIVIERTVDGDTRIIRVDGEKTYPPYTGPPLRPYVVRDDGAIEYYDGEVVEQDATVIRPPDMRVIE